MIIYTPWPMEEILGSVNQKEPQYRELDIPGAKLLVEQTAVDTCKVVRLLSTNPADYLRAEYQPGTELQFAPAAQQIQQ